MLLAQKNSVRQGFIGELVGSRILLTPGTWHSGHNIKGKPFDLCESGVDFLPHCFFASCNNAMNACVWCGIFIEGDKCTLKGDNSLLGGRSHTAIVGPLFGNIQKAASNWRTSTLFTYCE